MEFIIVFVGANGCYKVQTDGKVFRETRGEWKPVYSKRIYEEALKKARNLMAVRKSANRRTGA